ncbi:MAG: glycerophosphodiester phosphodiesterase [Bacillota bacterium]|nr:glycerophosphodiester phosphodiesterase [Bacillota bacterium]
MKILNIAHRGFSGEYPENTMLAFREAIEAGADGIETDVQLTKDGIPILCHDETLERTTDGEGYIKDWLYEEILHLDAGVKYSDEFRGVKIPTLDELLDYAKDKEILLNLELKNSIINYEGLEEIVIKKVHEYNLCARVIISSFNHYSLVRCKEIDTEIKVGLLYDCWLFKPEEYCRNTGADALHPSFYSLNQNIVENTHKAGFIINTYTVNELDDMKRMISMGVDGIITNYPDKLAELLN